MKDTIYREDAIEAVREKLQDWGGYTFEDYRRGLYEAQDIIEALPSAEAEQGWIPCSERLPDVDVDVLTTTDWSEVLIAWLLKCGAWETEGSVLVYDEITAWMPLPKPYKGGDDE